MQISDKILTRNKNKSLGRVQKHTKFKITHFHIYMNENSSSQTFPFSIFYIYLNMVQCI